DGNKTKLLAELKSEMANAAKNLQFEKAARLRDEVTALESLSLRGNLEEHAQPEVFYVDPQKGLAGLKQVFKLEKQPRNVEGVDIAHLQGGETVASLVQFIDGLPFKHGYKRYKIRGVEGVDDFASMREVVSDRKSTRLNSSHVKSSYAACRDLHCFPTRRSSDLKQVFKLEKQPRNVEGVDIAHLQGGETVASLVQFIDGLPFKHGYKRYKIRGVEGVDDFASMREVV